MPDFLAETSDFLKAAQQQEGNLSRKMSDNFLKHIEGSCLSVQTSFAVTYEVTSWTPSIRYSMNSTMPDTLSTSHSSSRYLLKNVSSLPIPPGPEATIVPLRAGWHAAVWMR